jgi:hypothetical protein
MKKHWIWITALILLLAAALGGCIGRDKARLQDVYYTVTFYDGDMILAQERVAEGQTVDALPAADAQWQDEQGQLLDPLTVLVTEDRSFYVSNQQEEREATAVRTGHVSFMPVTEEEFHPSQALTRAELAAILYRLLPEDGIPERTENIFSDAPEGDVVYYPAVLTVGTLGLMKGYPDGTFRPDEPVTRAELVSALYRLCESQESIGSSGFSDVSEDNWAYEAICYAAEQGWITGYGDGKFYPEAQVTRAQAAVVVERFLGREPDTQAIDYACGLTPYRDVAPTHWAYYEIVEAAYTNEFLAYVWGEVEGAEPGFILLDDQLCHINEDTLCLDFYEQGFHTIDGGLYYVSRDGYFIQRFQEGLLELNGSMYYVTADDGPFLTDDSFGYLTFGSDGRYTSGSDYVDEKVDEILADILYDTSMTQEEKLYAAYCAIRDGGYYYLTRDTGWERGSTGWSLGCAAVMFETKGGVCYYWASAFLYLARRLGYQAYAVCGGVGTKNQIHAWVVIEWDDGESYIFDVELEWAYSRGFYNGNYTPTDMFKQPLNATKVIYVFPGESGTYYGVAEDNNDEDALDVPPEAQVPPEATETPAETTSPDNPDGTQPDATVAPDNTDTPSDPVATEVPSNPDTPDTPDDTGTTLPVDPVPVEPAPVEPDPVEPLPEE